MLHQLRTYATTPLVHPLLLQGGRNRDEAAGKAIYEMEICVENKKKSCRIFFMKKGWLIPTIRFVINLKRF